MNQAPTDESSPCNKYKIPFHSKGGFDESNPYR